MPYCPRCGTPNPDDSDYCRKCGVPLRLAANQDQEWGHHHRRHDPYYNGRGSGIGALLAGAIVIVVGLGVFFPEIPWDEFWAALLIFLGIWIISFWALRTSRNAARQAGLTQG